MDENPAASSRYVIATGTSSAVRTAHPPEVRATLGRAPVRIMLDIAATSAVTGSFASRHDRSRCDLECVPPEWIFVLSHVRKTLSDQAPGIPTFLRQYQLSA